MNQALQFWTRAALIAAAYALLTITLAPLSYGMIQVRAAEALAVLPYFTPAAVPGLFAGCLIANIYGGNGLLDICCGSLASLLAALATARIRPKALAPLPPVIFNAIIVGLVLHFVLRLPFHLTMLWVGIGQLIACYGLGYPLLLFLEERRDLFKL